MARIISEDNPTWPSHFCITIISTTHHNTSQHNTQTKHVLCAVSCSCTTYKSFLTTRQWMNRKYCSCEVNEDLNQDSEKKYLYFTLILNSLTKRHTERYRERERERERERTVNQIFAQTLSQVSLCFLHDFRASFFYLHRPRFDSFPILYFLHKSLIFTFSSEKFWLSPSVQTLFPLKWYMLSR